MKAEEARKIQRNYLSDETALKRLYHEIEVSASAGRDSLSVTEKISDSVRAKLEADGYNVGYPATCSANNTMYTTINW